MPVRTLVVGPLMANCHLLIEGDGIAVIDPGGNPEQIVAAIEEIGLPAKVIIDTHGHADHIAANDVLRDRFEAPVLIHEADARMLIDPAANFSAMFGIALRLRAADRLLGDGDVIDVGARDGVYVRKGAHPGTGAEEGGANSVPTIGLLRVIHTPGHSPGGICLLCSEGLFTGDTLFAGSVGRTDFPGGDWEVLQRSIKERLLPLGDRTIIYPGHGPASTLGRERGQNHFLQGL